MSVTTIFVILIGLLWWARVSAHRTERPFRADRQQAAAQRAIDLVASQARITSADMEGEKTRTRLLTLAVAGDVLGPLLADGALEEKFGDRLEVDLNAMRAGLGGIVDELRKRAVVGPDANT